VGRDSSPAAGVHAGIYYRKFGHSRRGILVPNAAWLANDLQGLVEDRTVVFYDPRGRGNSVPLPDNTPATLEGELEDLDLVRRHCGLDQVTLFGWSYHGGVAAHYAGRHPEVVPRLVLSGPIAPRRVPYSDQAAAALQSRLDMAAVAEFMKSPPADPAEATKVWNAIALRGYFAACGAFARSAPKPSPSENERPRHVAGHVNALMASFGDWDWRPLAAAYAGPVLILHGADDWNPIEGSREWQASFPNARLVAIPNAGHFIWLEQPEAFFAALHQFLGGRPTAS
jgi:proline iminopeptidase